MCQMQQSDSKNSELCFKTFKTCEKVMISAKNMKNDSFSCFDNLSLIVSSFHHWRYQRRSNFHSIGTGKKDQKRRKRASCWLRKEKDPPPAGTRTRCENPFLVFSPFPSIVFNDCGSISLSQRQAPFQIISNKKMVKNVIIQHCIC